MEETKISTELGFLESLKERISETFKLYDTSWFLFNETAKRLLKEYNQEYSYINELIKLDAYRGLQYISEPSSEKAEGWYSVLSSLIPQIDKGIMGLRSKISPLSPKEAQELKVLREELQKVLLGLQEEYGRNIEEAIRELEKGCFLGSTLISGRVIQHVFDQIPGKDIGEKIKALRDRGLVEEKGEVPPEYILKADRKARNYFSHDIRSFPDRSDAFELLLICYRLLKLLKAFKIDGREEI